MEKLGIQGLEVLVGCPGALCRNPEIDRFFDRHLVERDRFLVFDMVEPVFVRVLGDQGGGDQLRHVVLRLGPEIFPLRQLPEVFRRVFLDRPADLSLAGVVAGCREVPVVETVERFFKYLAAATVDLSGSLLSSIQESTLSPKRSPV